VYLSDDQRGHERIELNGEVEVIDSEILLTGDAYQVHQ
jgi:hypothetical protein